MKIECTFEEFKNLNKYQLLALAKEIGDKKIAWDIMHIASSMCEPEEHKFFYALYETVAMHIVRENDCDEFYYQNKFNENFSKICLGKIVEVKPIKRNYPDSWVKLEHIQQEIPVEVKLNKFDSKALRQLQRYMKVYKRDFGIAVGKELTVKLPNNVEFISLEEIDF